MKILLVLLSICSLLLTIVPSILVFNGMMTLDMNKTLMLIGTVGWFITAPYWMNKEKVGEQE